MRVTSKMLFDSLTGDIAKANERLFKTLETLSSGKKVNRPSDDPVKVSDILGYKKIISGLEQYKRNIQFADTYLTGSEVALSEVSQLLTGLKQLTVAAGPADAQTRLTYASDVGEKLNYLISLGNTKIGDRYIFAGFKNDTEPFSTTGAYQGDSNEAQIQVKVDTAVAYGMTGDSIFKSSIDIFSVVSDLKAALEADDDAAIQGAIAKLNSSVEQITNSRSEIAARQNRLISHKNWIANFTLEAKNLLSEMEDADMSEVALNLAMEQTALEALQRTSVKIFELNIFNFIR